MLMTCAELTMFSIQETHPPKRSFLAPWHMLSQFFHLRMGLHEGDSRAFSAFENFSSHIPFVKPGQTRGRQRNYFFRKLLHFCPLYRHAGSDRETLAQNNDLGNHGHWNECGKLEAKIWKK